MVALFPGASNPAHCLRQIASNSKQLAQQGGESGRRERGTPAACRSGETWEAASLLDWNVGPSPQAEPGAQPRANEAPRFTASAVRAAGEQPLVGNLPGAHLNSQNC